MLGYERIFPYICGMNRKLIVNARILTMNARMDEFAEGSVLVEGGRIREVCAGRLEAGDAEVTDAGGMVVMPGFVNVHTHLAMTMFRGYADDLPLREWLEERIFPAEARRVREESVRAAVRLALVEMVKSGTTCFNDMYFFEDAVAEEARKAGMRGVVGESLIDFPTPSFGTLEEGVRRTEALVGKWRGDALVGAGVCAHAPYTCSGETLRRAWGLAQRLGVRWQVHVAETRREVEEMRERTGMTPVRYLDSLGVLDGRLMAAHGVWLDEGEVELMVRRGAAVGHCPKSNLKLGSGMADVDGYVWAGMTVGLGTDGTASNNGLDMVEEMRFAALVAKGRGGDPTALPARAALRMATVEGARAMGLGEVTGSLEAGKRADLVVVNAGASNMVPVYDVYSAVVYAMESKNVVASMVEGEWLMRGRRLLTLDKEAAVEEMRWYMDKDFKQIG